MSSSTRLAVTVHPESVRVTFVTSYIPEYSTIDRGERFSHVFSGVARTYIDASTFHIVRSLTPTGKNDGGRRRRPPLAARLPFVGV